MKKILTAITATLALMFGILGATAPAQATDAETMAAGASIRFVAVQSGIPRTIDLYNTSNSGHTYQQSLGTTRNSVGKTCPKNSKYRLVVDNPDTSPGAGRTHFLDPGQCFYTTYAGVHDVYLYWA